MKAKLSSAERTRITALIHEYQAASHDCELALAWAEDPEEIRTANRRAGAAETALFEALYQPIEVVPIKGRRG